MLSKIILRAAATAIALTCTTGSASAETFNVMVLEQSFFPQTNYVQPGDTVIFTNNSGATRTVRSKNMDWSTPELVDGAQATITIGSDFESEFLSRMQGTGTPPASTSTDPNGPFIPTEDLSGNADLETETGTFLGVFYLSGQPESVIND
jgi:plastocyanin